MKYLYDTIPVGHNYIKANSLRIEWMVVFDQIHSFKQESVHTVKSGVQIIKSGVLTTYFYS